MAGLSAQQSARPAAAPGNPDPGADRVLAAEIAECSDRDPPPCAGEGATASVEQERSPGLHHAPQHVRQDAAVAEIFELVERVDAAQHRHRVDRAVGAVDAAWQLDTRLEAGGDAEHIEALAAVE